MTTPDDRPFSDTDDRRMTAADHEALDPDRSTDAATDLGEADRTTGGLAADRTTDAGEADRTTGGRERGVEWTAADNPPLVAADMAVDFRSRWEVIQQGFVDDPRNSVREADKLVDDLLKRLSMSFEEQHQGLEKQWSDGEPSTEDLRAALQKYRAFFQRLLAM
jgi:hypothetical protein